MSIKYSQDSHVYIDGLFGIAYWPG